MNAETKQSLALDVDTLMVGINKTIFATADDELRPVMNGVYINLEPQSVTFVATDAHKLVKYASETAAEAPASFILPKKPANLLRGLLPKEDGEITVEFDDKNVLFRLKNQVLICRLIEGNYPNYNAVIPANNPNKVFVDRLELLNAIRRVAVCSNQSTNLIKLDISKGTINLTAQDLDFSVSAQESLPCDYEGEDIVIGFKSTFLIDIVEHRDHHGACRVGRFDPCGRFQTGLRPAAEQRYADAADADDDQLIAHEAEPDKADCFPRFGNYRSRSGQRPDRRDFVGQNNARRDSGGENAPPQSRNAHSRGGLGYSRYLRQGCGRLPDFPRSLQIIVELYRGMRFRGL